MSSPLVSVPRRHARPQQADTIQNLLDAAVHVVETTGYEGLTIRGVAQRAKVAPATAYTYFASKDHLLAEVFWRRLQTTPTSVIDQRKSAADRVAVATRDLALLVGDEPALAAAVTTALLAHDPDVKQLRDQMGVVFVQRLHEALGKDATPELVDALVLALTGALLMAGMGNVDYRELPGRLAGVTALIIGTRRRAR
ncbi:MAG: TetR/AcrR family transcriptional regulator [Actinomycetes bacterium]